MSEQPQMLGNQPWIDVSDWSAVACDVDKLEHQQQVAFFKRKKIAKSLEKVRSHISRGAMIGRSSLLAVGYIPADEGVGPNSAQLIDVDNVAIRDVLMRQINGEDRVVIDCEAVDPNDESLTMPYVVPILGILRAETQVGTDNPMMNHIATAKIHLQRMFDDSDFFTLGADAQHAMLSQRVARSFTADYAVEYDEDVTVDISCRQSFVRDFGDMNPPGWSDCQRGSGIVHGAIIDSVHLETLQRPQQQLATKQDFMFGGLPCMVVSNDDDQTLTYIPIGEITDCSSDVIDY